MEMEICVFQDCLDFLQWEDNFNIHLLSMVLIIWHGLRWECAHVYTHVDTDTFDLFGTLEIGVSFTSKFGSLLLKRKFIESLFCIRLCVRHQGYLGQRSKTWALLSEMCFLVCHEKISRDFSGGPVVKNLPWNAGDIGLISVSVQFSHSISSDSLWLHGLQHTRLPCPPPTPRACSNSRPLSQWCHPTISSSSVPFSCLQSFQHQGLFQ